MGQTPCKHSEPAEMFVCISRECLINPMSEWSMGRSERDASGVCRCGDKGLKRLYLSSFPQQGLAGPTQPRNNFYIELQQPKGLFLSVVKHLVFSASF